MLSLLPLASASTAAASETRLAFHLICPLRHCFTNSQATSLLRTSNNPSIAIIRTSSDPVRLMTLTSGSEHTYGYKIKYIMVFGTVQYSTTSFSLPRDLEVERTPSTHPPAVPIDDHTSYCFNPCLLICFFR